MTVEERLERIESIFNVSGRLKSEAEIREKINSLEKEKEELTKQINNSSSKSATKDLYIKRYKVEDFINNLKWCFEESD